MKPPSLAEELDQQIERRLRLSGPPSPHPDALLSLAEDLLAMPRPAFRRRLGDELLAKAHGADAPASLVPGLGWTESLENVPSNYIHQPIGATGLAETLPTLAGLDFHLLPVDHRSFLFSFLSHSALIALILSAIVIGSPPMTKTAKAVSHLTYLSLDHGGGGSGGQSAIPVSKGTAPKFSEHQLLPPLVVESHASRLLVSPTVMGPPEVKLPSSTELGDVMALSAILPSNGSGAGGAMGSGSGTGLGSGIGTGVGTGRDGGFGGTAFPNLAEVGAPRAIFSPDPEYSEEARKAKQQGIVVLSLVVGPDGRPRDIHVVRSLGMGLDEKAMEALRKWRFEPGRKAGVRVAMQVNVEVSFRLY